MFVHIKVKGHCDDTCNNRVIKSYVTLTKVTPGVFISTCLCSSGKNRLQFDGESLVKGDNVAQAVILRNLT